MREITLPGVNENYESDLERFEKKFHMISIKTTIYISLNNQLLKNILFFRKPDT